MLRYRIQIQGDKPRFILRYRIQIQGDKTRFILRYRIQIQGVYKQGLGRKYIYRGLIKPVLGKIVH